MTYLDYSATTPVDDEVLKTFVKASKYIGNPNSLHKLGINAKELIDASTNQIANILGVKANEIIYTSGASEANNTVIKGIENYKSRGNHIITTNLEHSSIYGPLKYMQDRGYEISYVPLKNGLVDINALENMVTDKTVLVTISAVNSETGVRQNIEQIGQMLKKYPKVIFHSDITQAVGKINIDLANVDLASFSAHKFFGIKGIGALIKKENITLTPLIAGGKSTTAYRSGTPSTSLIASMAKALRLAYENLNVKYVENLNNKIKDKLKTYEKVHINSNEFSVPHILNFSISGVKPETFLHALEEDEVYISTQSACAKGNSSRSVLALTGSDTYATTSLRISLSIKTTMQDVNKFLDSFDKNYRKLVIKWAKQMHG